MWSADCTHPVRLVWRPALSWYWFRVVWKWQAEPNVETRGAASCLPLEVGPSTSRGWWPCSGQGEGERCPNRVRGS